MNQTKFSIRSIWEYCVAKKTTWHFIFACYFNTLKSEKHFKDILMLNYFSSQLAGWTKNQGHHTWILPLWYMLLHHSADGECHFKCFQWKAQWVSVCWILFSSLLYWLVTVDHMWFLTSHVSLWSALLTNQFCLFSCLWIQDCESITNHQRLFCSCIRKYYSYQLTED